tara:strand:- start:1296 stop:1835 length:540 start_codon:yes stop_codon:yes gene_type:complete
MIWFVSGPSCVGKSHFIGNERNKLEEITYGKENSDTFKESFKVIQRVFTQSRNWTKIKDNVIVVDLVLVQYDIDGDNPWNGMWKQIYNSEIEKKVIVLGVSVSEYKRRISQRMTARHGPSGVRFSDLLQNTSTTTMIQFYKDWIRELKSKGVSYLLVEAKQYKILEEDDFLNMIKGDTD